MPTASYEKFQPALELMLEGGNLGTETYADCQSERTGTD